MGSPCFLGPLSHPKIAEVGSPTMLNSTFNLNILTFYYFCKGVVRMGATGAMAPMDFENMCFGTRRFKTKRLKNHREMPAKTIFSCTKSVIGTR